MDFCFISSYIDSVFEVFLHENTFKFAETNNYFYLHLMQSFQLGCPKFKSWTLVQILRIGRSSLETDCINEKNMKERELSHALYNVHAVANVYSLEDSYVTE